MSRFSANQRSGYDQNLLNAKKGRKVEMVALFSFKFRICDNGPYLTSDVGHGLYPKEDSFCSMAKFVE